jgi:hypothetical protein
VKTFSVSVGRLLCGKFRSVLARERFMGRQIEWLESPGWFSRVFTVRGKAADVDAVYEVVGFMLKVLLAAGS